MEIAERPYFMKNKEWYTYDYKNLKYILTDKAPKKAKESYNEFYKIVRIKEEKNEKIRIQNNSTR